MEKYAKAQSGGATRRPFSGWLRQQKQQQKQQLAEYGSNVFTSLRIRTHIERGGRSKASRPLRAAHAVTLRGQP